VRYAGQQFGWSEALKLSKIITAEHFLRVIEPNIKCPSTAILQDNETKLSVLAGVR